VRKEQGQKKKRIAREKHFEVDNILRRSSSKEEEPRQGEQGTPRGKSKKEWGIDLRPSIEQQVN